MPPPPDIRVTPGWYTTDRERNVQGYWDGTKWSKARRWRGVGFFEEPLHGEASAGTTTPTTNTTTAAPATTAAAASGSTGGGVGTGMATITVLHRHSAGRPKRDRPLITPPLMRVETVSTPTPSSAPPPPPSPPPPSTPRSGAILPTPPGPTQRPSWIQRAPRRLVPPPPSQSPPKTNGLAVASLVLSIISLFGFGSILGIILGVKARKEIRWSRGNQAGDGLALAGIIIGICTLTIVVVAISLWTIGFVRLTNRFEGGAAASSEVLACQLDARTVDVAVTAYQAENGTYPTPPAVWTAATYQSNFTPLTTGTKGGPWLRTAPSTGSYVVEYDSAGHIWVAPPGVYESSYQPGQTLGSDPDACDNAVG